jgi:hypothetical protein
VSETRFGFDWGPMKVERLAHIPGRGYVVQIGTEHVSVQVYVSEKGRKVTAYEPRPVEATQERAA